MQCNIYSLMVRCGAEHFDTVTMRHICTVRNVSIPFGECGVKYYSKYSAMLSGEYGVIRYGKNGAISTVLYVRCDKVRYDTISTVRYGTASSVRYSLNIIHFTSITQNAQKYAFLKARISA